MEEIYKSAINEVNRIIKDKGRAPRPERAVQLAAQARDLHEQVRGILNRAKEELEKARLHNRTETANGVCFR